MRKLEFANLASGYQQACGFELPELGYRAAKSATACECTLQIHGVRTRPRTNRGTKVRPSSRIAGGGTGSYCSIEGVAAHIAGM